MINTVRDYFYLALADDIFAECMTIPSHVDACECKKKRDLRDALYALHKAASKGGCENVAIKIAGHIHKWLDSGEVSNESLSGPAREELERLNSNGVHYAIADSDALGKTRVINASEKYLVLGDKPIAHPGRLDRTEFASWLSNLSISLHKGEGCLEKSVEAAREYVISTQAELAEYRHSIAEKLTASPREPIHSQESTEECP